MRNAVPAHSTNPNRFKTDCPFCGKKDHFYFDIKTKSGICFVCMDHHVKLDAQFIIGPDNAPTKDLDELRGALKKVFDRPRIEKSGVDIDLFSEPINSKRHPKSIKYLLEERGLSMEDIVKYDIRSGKSYMDEETGRVIMKWTGRVIFPFYEDGVCVYAIGRTYMGDDRKYINVDVPKTNIVYGIDKIKNKECIICEGFLSAVAAEKATGISAVCLLGKTISQFQLYKIRTKADRVWQSLDGGVPESQVKSMSKSLLKAGFREVWRVDLPGKGELDIHGEECTKDYDPDDLGEEYLEYFNKAQRVKYL